MTLPTVLGKELLQILILHLFFSLGVLLLEQLDLTWHGNCVELRLVCGIELVSSGVKHLVGFKHERLLFHYV